MCSSKETSSIDVQTHIVKALMVSRKETQNLIEKKAKKTGAREMEACFHAQTCSARKGGKKIFALPCAKNGRSKKADFKEDFSCRFYMSSD